MSLKIYRFQFFLLYLVSFSSLFAQIGSPRIEEVKENILSALSGRLKGKSQENPILILIGGYVGSGKTTLANAIEKNYGMTIFSLNSIRQAMLDEGIDIRGNKEEERNVLFEIYPKLLAPCIANLQHIVIDANANRQGIADAVRFLDANAGCGKYKIIKIHLFASEKELYARVNARIQQAGIHQGTRADLAYELRTLTKAIYREDYDLVIDTETTLFEDEMKIIDGFLQSYLDLS